MRCANIAFSHIALQMTPLFASLFLAFDSCAQQAHFLSLQHRQTGMQSQTSRCFPALYFTLDCCLDIHIKHIGNACEVDDLLKPDWHSVEKGPEPASKKTKQNKTKTRAKYKCISNKQVKASCIIPARLFLLIFCPSMSSSLALGHPPLRALRQ